MDSRRVCKGHCRVCGARACIHRVGHYGGHECARHCSNFLNSVAGIGDSALSNWLEGLP